MNDMRMLLCPFCNTNFENIGHSRRFCEECGDEVCEECIKDNLCPDCQDEQKQPEKNPAEE